MSLTRTAFFVSDRTGITAEMFGHMLLTQFESIRFDETTLSFVDSVEKARTAVAQINLQGKQDGLRPLIFSTLVNRDVSAIIAEADALFIDCFDTFLAPIESELGVRATRAIGRSHSANNFADYHHRIEAINYTLGHDDGITDDFSGADIVLIGISRCGKTPTCLYLAMQFGIRAGNWPLVAEDFGSVQLSAPLQPWRKKLFGLTISPERLQEIRNARQPNSKYAALESCAYEVRAAEKLMQQENIPCLDTTSKSVEELAATILHMTRLRRKTR
jgi:hypothetical protein